MTYDVCQVLVYVSVTRRMTHALTGVGAFANGAPLLAIEYYKRDREMTAKVVCGGASGSGSVDVIWRELLRDVIGACRQKSSACALQLLSSQTLFASTLSSINPFHTLVPFHSFTPVQLHLPPLSHFQRARGLLYAFKNSKWSSAVMPMLLHPPPPPPPPPPHPLKLPHATLLQTLPDGEREAQGGILRR